MAYEKQTWKDGEEGGTPITAERLNHIEQGIEEKAEQGPKGEPGADGNNGSDGSDGAKGDPGADGSNGSNGSDGVGVTDIKRDGNNLVFTMTDGEDITVELPDVS